MSINNVNISGNLGRDAELKSTASGNPALQFSVCVNDRTNQNGQWVDRPNWVPCVMYGNRASALSKHLLKGTKVSITGRLRQSQWERDGQKHSRLEVIVNEIELMGSRSQQNQQPQQGEYQQQPAIDMYGTDIPF